jgi:hypothetical protein
MSGPEGLEDLPGLVTVEGVVQAEVLDDRGGLGLGRAEDDGQVKAVLLELAVARVQVIQTWDAEWSNDSL